MMGIWIETKYRGYFVNELGEVRGRSGKITIGHVHKSTGYLRICVNGEGTPYVHRLICETFHGPPPTSSHQIAHWNGDKTDNRASNLRWATIEENNKDRIRHETYSRGDNHKRSKLNEDAVRDIRMSKEPWRVLCRRYGIGEKAIWAVKTRRTWKHVI